MNLLLRFALLLIVWFALAIYTKTTGNDTDFLAGWFGAVIIWRPVSDLIDRYGERVLEKLRREHH